MKLLQNPKVVGVLAVLALAFVFYNTVWPNLHSAAPSKHPTRSTAAPARKPAIRQQKPLRKGATPGPAPALAAMDQSNMLFYASQWESSPLRNPFQGLTNENHSTNSAQQVLSLTSILRQTGESVAVINRHVVSPGDQVGKFRIGKIEAEQVWVWGPNGHERVAFKHAIPTPAHLKRTLATPAKRNQAAIVP